MDMKKKKLKIFKDLPTLRCERFVLRKISASDLTDVHEYASNPDVSRYLLWYPHKTLSYTRQYLKYLEKLYRKGKFYDWGIEFQGKMIGTVGFSSFNFKENSAEIGYVLNPDFWGRGIVAEGIFAILKFAFLYLDLSAVEAIFLPENTQSRRVLEKCNFKYRDKKLVLVKGEYRYVEVFSISKEDFSL